MKNNHWRTNKDALEPYRLKEFADAWTEYVNSREGMMTYLTREYIREESLKAWGALRLNCNVRYDERGKTWRPITKNVPTAI